jgi:hypothetical protein
MSKKTLSTASMLHRYQLTDPSASSISFEGNIYPVDNGLVTLTTEEAAPLLASGAIYPAPAAPLTGDTSTPLFDLPAEQ